MAKEVKGRQSYTGSPLLTTLTFQNNQKRSLVLFEPDACPPNAWIVAGNLAADAADKRRLADGVGIDAGIVHPHGHGIVV
jgi:hypothetical protein